MGAFLIVCLGKTAEEAILPFKHLQLVAFRDAGEEPCNYECTVLDCLRGLEKAISYSWYNYLKFDYKVYEANHKLDNGDMNWVIPNKILALSSPTDIKGEGLSPSFFLESF
jgi:cell division cycle 14